MRTFITGVDGFIGSWLAETLAAAGDEVSGLSRARAGGDGRDGGVTRYQGDLSDAGALETVLRAARPERLFHLAAQNNIKDSFANPAVTIAANVTGSVNLFDAVRRAAPEARVVSVGSSAEYGHTAATVPVLGEDVPLLPTSPYGITKASQGLFVRVYAKVYGLRAMHVRPFAIVGPRKTRDALSDFSRNVVAIERGATDVFSVGYLGSERDFVDVRDCVTALTLISAQGAIGETYNLCNGRIATLATVLEELQRLSRRPFAPVQDPSRLRPADDHRIVGDPSRLRALGYAPRFSLAETIAATLEYWRTLG